MLSQVCDQFAHHLFKASDHLGVENAQDLDELLSSRELEPVEERASLVGEADQLAPPVDDTLLTFDIAEANESLDHMARRRPREFEHGGELADALFEVSFEDEEGDHLRHAQLGGVKQTQGLIVSQFTEEHEHFADVFGELIERR
jgi:hypothetical protein